MSNKKDHKQSKKTVLQERLEALGYKPSPDFSKQNQKHITIKSKPKASASTPEKSEVEVNRPRRDAPKKSTQKMKRVIYKLKQLLYMQYGIEFEKLEQLTHQKRTELKRDLEQIKGTGNAKITVSVTNGDYQISIIRNSEEKPKPTKPTIPGKSTLTKKIRLDDFNRYSYVKLTRKSTLNPKLLAKDKIATLAMDLTGSYRTQKFEDHGKETELVVGVDFGTANTKVVIQEQGKRKAWAIPFTNDAQNPYLLPSNVYFYDQRYKLSGNASDKIGNLKLPLIMGYYESGNLIKITAFIALVIRQSREWFLANAADLFPQFTFDWFYHMGLPAANNDNEELLRVYKKVLLAALKLSVEPEKDISRDTVITCLDSIDQTGTENDHLSAFIGVHPEIQAQLEGYVRSDKWDANKIKFMMVDVGSGTVDASIVNVTTDEDDKAEFHCLESKVDTLGIAILHSKRLGWIKYSAKRSEAGHQNLIDDISKAKANFENIKVYPDLVEAYVDNSSYPSDFSLDNVFYDEFNCLIKQIINKVKNDIDPMWGKANQWRLQLILCGGGSLHPLYRKITTWPKLDIISLSRPDKSRLVAESLHDDDYHRLSVAYGLSFSDQGKFINTSQIPPIKLIQEKSEQSWRSNYIEQP